MGSPRMTALPPPWSNPASAFLYDIAVARCNTSWRASSSLGYGWNRVPPRAGPSAVEWIAMIARSPEDSSRQKTTCSWSPDPNTSVTWWPPPVRWRALLCAAYACAGRIGPGQRMAPSPRVGDRTTERGRNHAGDRSRARRAVHRNRRWQHALRPLGEPGFLRVLVPL